MPMLQGLVIAFGLHLVLGANSTSSTLASNTSGAARGRIVQLEVFKEDGCQPSELKSRELYPPDVCMMFDGARWAGFFLYSQIYPDDPMLGGPYWKKVHLDTDGGLKTTMYADSACTLEESTHPLAAGAPEECTQSYVRKGYVTWTE